MFARKSPGPKNVKPPVPKPCKHCGEPFLKARPLQRACGWKCAEILGKAESAKQVKKAKAEDAKLTRAQKEAIKTWLQLRGEAQTAFNAMIRARDWNQPCIDCGRFAKKDYLTGSNYDCGHYRSTGSASHLRFNEDNAHRQLSQCNQGQATKSHYRPGLIARIGLERVEALDNDNQEVIWTKDDLRNMRDSFRRRTREYLKLGHNAEAP